MNGESKLNVNSYISFGLAIGIVSVIVSGFLTIGAWIGGRFTDLNDKWEAKWTEQNKNITAVVEAARDEASEQKRLGDRMDKIEHQKASDPWTGTDMFKWAARLQHDNDSKIKVPEPEHDAKVDQ
jgi:hypothetical protein